MPYQLVAFEGRKRQGPLGTYKTYDTLEAAQKQIDISHTAYRKHNKMHPARDLSDRWHLTAEELPA
jgi:hypothetical protein